MTKVRMTKAQRAWCKHYEAETTFEPLMDDFLHGNESFVKAARDSLRWFEDWAGDALLRAERDIPGAEEHDEKQFNAEMRRRARANKSAPSTNATDR